MEKNNFSPDYKLIQEFCELKSFWWIKFPDTKMMMNYTPSKLLNIPIETSKQICTYTIFHIFFVICQSLKTFSGVIVL